MLQIGYIYKTNMTLNIYPFNLKSNIAIKPHQLCIIYFSKAIILSNNY